MLFLVTDKSSATPGRYIKTGKTNSEVIADVANALVSKETLKEYFSLVPFSTARRIYEAGLGGGSSLEAIVNKECNLNLINAIDKKTILESSISHDDNLFNGIFSSKKQYELLVKNLPSNDSDIFIGGIKDACAIFHNSHITSGIYFLHEGKLIKATDFSRSVFEDLRVAIIDVFSKLGAKQINITDTTESGGSAEISISKEITSLAPQLNLDFKKTTRFSIDAKLSGVRTEHSDEFIVDIRGKLKHAPELLTLAEHAALNPGALIGIKKEISLNIAFGMNVNLISLFQGAFQGGYERVFAVNLSF